MFKQLKSIMKRLFHDELDESFQQDMARMREVIDRIAYLDDRIAETRAQEQDVLMAEIRKLGGSFPPNLRVVKKEEK
jgi:hypothetical protein